MNLENENKIKIKEKKMFRKCLKNKNKGNMLHELFYFSPENMVRILRKSNSII